MCVPLAARGRTFVEVRGYRVHVSRCMTKSQIVVRNFTDSLHRARELRSSSVGAPIQRRSHATRCADTENRGLTADTHHMIVSSDRSDVIST